MRDMFSAIEVSGIMETTETSTDIASSGYTLQAFHVGDFRRPPEEVYAGYSPLSATDLQAVAPVETVKPGLNALSELDGKADPLAPITPSEGLLGTSGSAPVGALPLPITVGD